MGEPLLCASEFLRHHTWFVLVANCADTSWSRGYKTFFMHNSVEHEILMIISIKI